MKISKVLVSEEVNSALISDLQGLQRQGQMSRRTDPICAPIWARVVQTLPDEQMKFALNAAVDVLPHNANLHLWKKREDSSCPLCHENQSLLHILNNCSVARDARRYNLRHDSILKTLASTIKQAIAPTSTLTADTNDSYSFPLHITATDLRPDLVWWDDSHRSLYMAELTVCFETNFEEAARRKSAKYDHLVEQAKDKGYSTELILLQVGSRGVPDLPGFEKLAKILNFHRKELTKLLEESSRLALVGSFSIWCSRNRRP